MLGTMIVWFGIVALASVLYVTDGSAVALVVAIGMLAVLPVSAGANLLVRKTLAVSASGKGANQKSKSEAVTIMLGNPSFIPVLRVKCRVLVENQLNGQRQTIDITTWLPPKRTQQEALRLQSDYCGRLKISVPYVKLYDCFGVVGVRCQCDADCYTVVQPDTFPVEIQLAANARQVEDSDVYSQERPGSDLTETFQIREYVPGDSPRQIHWKLSGKFDKLIVRDPGLPVVRSVLVFWERTGESGNPACIDAQAETVVSLCRALLEQSTCFTLGWNDAAQNACVLQDIRTMEDLMAVLPKMLGTAGQSSGSSGAQLLLHTRQDALCAHMVYIAEKPGSDVADLQAFGRVTVLLWGNTSMENAIMPGCEDYAARLAQIEI